MAGAPVEEKEEEIVINFGEAIQAIKEERWVRRSGWNGVGMHQYLEDGLRRTMPRADVNWKVTVTEEGKYEPCIVMFTAQKRHQPGWLASQADMLAEDWEIVPWEETR